MFFIKKMAILYEKPLQKQIKKFFEKSIDKN